MKSGIGLLILILSSTTLWASHLHVGAGYPFASISEALNAAGRGDTVFVHAGRYTEGNIVIDKPLSLIGIDFPVLDGQSKFETITVKSSDVLIADSGRRQRHDEYD